MKTILITGGTGFLGRNLALYLKKDFNIIITGRNSKQNFQAKQITKCDVYPMDITRVESIQDVFTEVKPQIVIHAAATKFVDWAEKFPMECIDSNVIGSQNIARACINNNVEVVLGISTDKASPPVKNTYGLTKALMEKIFCSLNDKSNTQFACVRYGNVAWSTGSVLPIWKKMIEETNVIKTTGPEMRRFFFTVDEAVQLIITAIDNIDKIHGCVLAREMKSAKMLDFIKVWTEETNSTWEQITERPGERTDEFLIGEIEHPCTKEVTINNISHYIKSPNAKVNNPINKEISSKTATRLTKEEISYIINNPPVI